jgi:hypothetical protein
MDASIELLTRSFGVLALSCIRICVSMAPLTFKNVVSGRNCIKGAISPVLTHVLSAMTSCMTSSQMVRARGSDTGSNVVKIKSHSVPFLGRFGLINSTLCFKKPRKVFHFYRISASQLFLNSF